MLRVLLLSAVVVLLCSVTFSQMESKPFESSDHKFKAVYPGPVHYSKGSLSPAEDGNYYDFKSTLAQLKQSFGVQVIDDTYSHKNPTDEQMTIRLNRSRDSLVSGVDEGKLVSEREFRLNGRLCREFVVENKSYLLMARVHYFHNRIYLVMAVLKKSSSENKEFEAAAKSFLESFVILD